MSWDLQTKSRSQEERKRENQLKERFGDEYKAPYVAFYKADDRCPRLKVLNETKKGKETGFIMQYMHIDPIEFTDSSVITLNYKHEIITIIGHHLSEIISGIEYENLTCIRVFNGDLYRNELTENDAFVETITRTQLKSK